MGKIARAFVFFTVVFLLSCSDENSTPFKAGTQPKLNIEGSSGLVVYEGSSASNGRLASQETNFYKINTNGYVEEVKVLYDDNTEIGSDSPDTKMQVDRVFNINDNYFVLDGEFLVWDTLGNQVQYHSLLVRKTDGAIFEFRHPSHFGSDIHRSTLLEDETFYSDIDGNFYYLNSQEKVLKVDVSDPSKLFMIDYLPTGQNTSQYAIDGDGNCIYRYGYGNDLRVRKKQGGIYDILIEDLRVDFWVGTNEKIYLTTWGNSAPAIYQLVIDANNEASLSLVWENQINHTQFYASENHFKIRKENSIVFVGINGYKHWEFFEDNNNVVELELPNLSTETKVVYSDDYYYIATGTNLFKVSLADHTYQNILVPGQYEIYNMSVNAEEVLQVNALRFSDGKKILAEINEQDKFSLIDEEQDKEAMYLHRLN